MFSNPFCDYCRKEIKCTLNPSPFALMYMVTSLNIDTGVCKHFCCKDHSDLYDVKYEMPRIL